MIGNAVPVNLAKFVGQAINEFLSNEQVCEYKKLAKANRPYNYKYDSKQLLLFESKNNYGVKNIKE